MLLPVYNSNVVDDFIVWAEWDLKWITHMSSHPSSVIVSDIPEWVDGEPDGVYKAEELCLSGDTHD